MMRPVQACQGKSCLPIILPRRCRSGFYYHQNRHRRSLNCMMPALAHNARFMKHMADERRRGIEIELSDRSD
jgi:hypothetical protein